MLGFARLGLPSRRSCGVRSSALHAALLCSRKQLSTNTALTTHGKQRPFWDCFIKIL